MRGKRQGSDATGCSGESEPVRSYNARPTRPITNTLPRAQEEPTTTTKKHVPPQIRPSTVEVFSHCPNMQRNNSNNNNDHSNNGKNKRRQHAAWQPPSPSPSSPYKHPWDIADKRYCCSDPSSTLEGFRFYPGAFSQGGTATFGERRVGSGKKKSGRALPNINTAITRPEIVGDGFTAREREPHSP